MCGRPVLKVMETRVLGIHVLRNASIPIVTEVMASLPALLIGAFLIERFFGIPGLVVKLLLRWNVVIFP